jgi:cyclo(L-tyrosyl-L-tyrosyl) synthase
MKLTPDVTKECQNSLSTKTHACFGISPFNSYFSESRIQTLAEWGKIEFQTMHFFVPDIPSAYTLEALGYEPEKAAWKARRQAQYLFNKIYRALKNVGFSLIQSEEMILNWEKLSNNDHYLNLYAKVQSLFEKDLEFQSACIQASRWVLEKRVPDETQLNEDVLRSAARYLLTEIPLFLDTAGIVEKPSSSFCYHQCIPFIEKLMKGHFNLRPSGGQSFAIIDPSEPIECHRYSGIEAS